MSTRDILKEYRLLMRAYSGLRSWVGRANDRYYGVETESKEAFRFKDLCADSRGYEPAPYWLLKKIVRVIKPRPEDVFFDIGCGKGRALAVFSLYRSASASASRSIRCWLELPGRTRKT